MFAMRVYTFNPILPLAHLASYYSLSQVFISSGAALIHVPFVGPDTFCLRYIIPFPSNITRETTTSIVLSGIPDFLLYNSHHHDFAFRSLSTLALCKDPLFDNLVCPASIVSVDEFSSDLCMSAIAGVNIHDISSHCQFKEMNASSTEVEKNGDLQYVSALSQSTILLCCPPSPPKCLTILGRFSFKAHCTFSGDDSHILGFNDHIKGTFIRTVQLYTSSLSH